MKQKTGGMERKNRQMYIIVGNLNTPLSKTGRTIGQKTRKDREKQQHHQQTGYKVIYK